MARRIHLKIPKFNARLHPWTPEEEALLGVMTDPELAARLGVSVGAVAHRRRRLGRGVRYAKRRPWTPGEEALLGTVRDTELAARLGRHTSTVCIRRQQLGIPNFYWHNRLGRERRMGKSSTLKQLSNLLGAHYLPIIYDLQSRGISSSPTAFFTTVAEETYSVMNTRGIKRDIPNCSASL